MPLTTAFQAVVRGSREVADNFMQARGSLFNCHNIGYEKIRSAPLFEKFC